LLFIKKRTLDSAYYYLASVQDRDIFRNWKINWPLTYIVLVNLPGKKQIQKQLENTFQICHSSEKDTMGKIVYTEASCNKKDTKKTEWRSHISVGEIKTLVYQK